METALDFAILGIGATGAIFENDTINQVFQEHSAVVFPMLSQSVVIPPFNEYPEEVLSYVCPASQFHPVHLECRMVSS